MVVQLEYREGGRSWFFSVVQPEKVDLTLLNQLIGHDLISGIGAAGDLGNRADGHVPMATLCRRGPAGA